MVGHVTIDAGFSGEDGIAVLRDMGFLVTASVNRQHKQWLFNLLKAYGKDSLGTIWSLLKNGPGEHFLMTTGFQEVDILHVEIPPPLNSEQIGFLSKIGLRGLSLIATELEIDLDGSEFELASAIATELHRRTEATITSINPNLSVSSSSFHLSPSSSSNQNVLSEIELKSKKMKELTIVAKEKGLKPVGRKKDLIQ